MKEDAQMSLVNESVARCLFPMLWFQRTNYSFGKNQSEGVEMHRRLVSVTNRCSFHRLKNPADLEVCQPDPIGSEPRRSRFQGHPPILHHWKHLCKNLAFTRWSSNAGGPAGPNKTTLTFQRWTFFPLVQLYGALRIAPKKHGEKDFVG